MTHWNASGGAKSVGATEEVATGRPQAVRKRAAIRICEGLVKVYLRLWWRKASDPPERVAQVYTTV
jgi:hypothetical protein